MDKKPSQDDEMRDLRRRALEAIRRLKKEKPKPAAADELWPGEWIGDSPHSSYRLASTRTSREARG